MDSKRVYDPSLWPKERKLKSTEGKLDELGFFYTPNGSFYDYDNEYFNKNGYDIHGGFYTDNKEYINGPDWNSELGCYEDEKDKYLNINLDDELDAEDEDGFIEEGDNFDDFDDGIDFDYEKAMKEAEKFKADLEKEANQTKVKKVKRKK